MNTSLKILGSFVFLVSSVWLIAVQAHPLLVMLNRGGYPQSVVVSWLCHIPYPPPIGDEWWPVLCGFGGVLVGTVLVVSSRPRRSDIETVEIIEIYERKR